MARVRLLEKRWLVGLDIGQRKDHTAFAVIEWRRCCDEDIVDRVNWTRREWQELDIRYVERIPLGTSYTGVAERVRDLTRREPLCSECTLVADDTGVGAPVVELIKQSVTCEVVGVSITGGDRAGHKAGRLCCPKRDLVHAVAISLEQDAIRISEGLPQAQALIEELLNFGVEVSAEGHDSYGAVAGKHDDLVLAVALPVWWIRWMHSGVCAEQPGRKLLPGAW